MPRRNLQVLKPDFAFAEGRAVDAMALAAAIRGHLAAFDLDGADADVALAFQWAGAPEYARIRGFAEGLRDGLSDRLDRGLPKSLPEKIFKSTFLRSSGLSWMPGWLDRLLPSNCKREYHIAGP